MIRTEFENQINLHNSWLSSKGKNGKKLILKDRKISNFDFSNLNLQGAEIESVFFESSVFYYTNMRGCTMKNVIFENSNLRFADFRCSDIESVNFSNSDLHETKLPGSNL